MKAEGAARKGRRAEEGFAVSSQSVIGTDAFRRARTRPRRSNAVADLALDIIVGATFNAMKVMRGINGSKLSKIHTVGQKLKW